MQLIARNQALARATHLVITLPHSANRNPLIASAKLINPEIKIFVRARYISERPELMQAGADAACFEELEAAVALARSVLFDRGADAEVIHRETIALRQAYGSFKVQLLSQLRMQVRRRVVRNRRQMNHAVAVL